MTALNFRALNILAVGVGYLGLTCLNKWNKNTFKVQALGLSQAPWKNDRMVFELGRYGIPKRDVLIEYEDIQLSYDNCHKTPNWVLEHLTYENLEKSVPLKELDAAFPQYIRDNDNIPLQFQVTVDDFRATGIKTVRLAAAKNHRHSLNGFKDTVYWNTMAGINAGLKTSLWPILEAYTRYLTAYYAEVFVFTGPLYIPRPLSESEVKIDVFGGSEIVYPTHFYKIIIGKKKNGQFAIGCYLVPNQCIRADKELTDFRIDIADLEKMAGFQMFKADAAYDNLNELYDVQDFRSECQGYMDHVKLGGLV